MTTFVIVNKEHWSVIDHRDCNETSLPEAKMSVDRSKVIISYEGSQPDFCYIISSDGTGLQEYTETEILDIIRTSEWSLPS